MKQKTSDWPDHPLSAEEERENMRRRIEDEPPMGAMGPDGKVRLFRPGKRPPPIRIVAELPADEDANG